jgi:hypothetical protein
MKDYLDDIVSHTHALGIKGVKDLVKVTGTDQFTQINAVAEDKSVILSATMNSVIPEFEGAVFGLPNLDKLATILGFSEYAKDAHITVTKVSKDGVDTPSAIHFENKNGDFANDYRLMSAALVNDMVKNVKFNGTAWHVTFTPSIASIGRLKSQAAANSEQTVFQTKVENGDLVVYFGDPSTHSGRFVWQANCGGAMSRVWQWPVKQVLAILALAGEKTIQLTDQGAMAIRVDSGLAVYQYLLPAFSK